MLQIPSRKLKELLLADGVVQPNQFDEAAPQAERMQQGIAEEAEKMNVRIFADSVIYKMIEDYTFWVAAEKEKQKNVEWGLLSPHPSLRG